MQSSVNTAQRRRCVRAGLNGIGRRPFVESRLRDTGISKWGFSSKGQICPVAITVIFESGCQAWRWLSKGGGGGQKETVVVQTKQRLSGSAVVVRDVILNTSYFRKY